MPETSGISVVAAFLAGAISFVSPCVLPLVPGYISYVAGRTAAADGQTHFMDRRLPAIGLSLCYVLGFSTVFVILGASATALGQLMLGYRYELNLVGGAIIVLFGLFMLGMARIPVLQRDLRIHLDIPGRQAPLPFAAAFHSTLLQVATDTGDAAVSCAGFSTRKKLGQAIFPGGSAVSVATDTSVAADVLAAVGQRHGRAAVRG